MTETQPYKTDSGVIMKDMLLSPSVGWPVWTALGAATAVAAVGAWVDLRWLAVGLMIALAVAPTIAAFTYFSHVLSPEIAPNMLPHTLERSDGGYTLRIWRRADEEEPEEAGEWIETGVIELRDSNITDRTTSFEYETLYYRDSPMKILYVPRIKK